MSKRTLVWLALVLSFAIGVWQYHRYASGQTLPSDTELIELFDQHRSTFEQLRRMAFEDNLAGSISLDFVSDKELASERVEDYRNLMRLARVEYFIGYSRTKLYFWVDGQHSVFGGRSKGIAYYPEQPQILVRDSLNESCLPLVGPSRDTCAAVRHIEGNWWLIRGDAS